jgi:hypothetical protein
MEPEGCLPCSQLTLPNLTTKNQDFRVGNSWNRDKVDFMSYA